MDRYKSALVWIDLEMTGLNPEHDTILEIATVVTTNNLELIAQGPSFVIINQMNCLLKWMPGIKNIIQNLV